MSELNKLYGMQDDIINSINDKRNEIELFEEDYTGDLEEELAVLELERDNISKMIEVATEQEYSDEVNDSDLLQELRKVSIKINSHIDTYNYKNIDTYRETIKLAIMLRKRASKDKKYDAYIKSINKSLGKLISLNKANSDI